MRQPRGRAAILGLLRHPAALVVAVFALSCIGDSTGPNVARPGALQLVPSFQTAAPSGLVPITKIRIGLTRPNGDAALDTVVTITLGSSEANLVLKVPVFTQADTFTAVLRLITPAGDTAFRAGPLQVIGTPATATSTPPLTAMPLVYVGVGANADSVVIVTQPSSAIFTGDTGTFQAVAFDNDVPVPGTPIGWISLDPSRAIIPRDTVGKAVGATQRGTARIVAQLLTGPADTGSVDVKLLPSTVNIISGNNQSGSISSLLPAPLLVELQASDGLVVQGIWVRFAVTAGGGSVSADSVLSDAQGRASVSWTLGSLPGAQSVRATSARGTAAQASFAATGVAISAASFAVTGLTSVGAGTVGSVTVTALDGLGNTVTNFNGTIHFTSNDPLATLPGDYTFIPTDNGTHTFSGGVTLKTAGSRTVTVTAAASSATGSQTVIVSPAAVVAFGVTGLTNPVVAGAVSTVTVTAKDQYGNIVTSYAGQVQFTSTDTAAILPAPYTFVPATDNGVHSFGGITLKTAGGMSVTVKDVAQPTITGSQGTGVTPDIAVQLEFTGQPVDAVTGGFLGTVVVKATDQFHNVATAFNNPVTITIGTNPGGGLLSGTNPVTAVNGVATFSNLAISNFANGYTLVASASGLTPATSALFNILAPTGTITWLSAVNGNWNDATKWSGNQVPGPTDVAAITVSGTYTVSMNANVSVAGLTLGGASGTQTLTQNSYTLTLNGPATVGAHGVLSLYGTTDGSGTITNQGAINTSYGTLNTPLANAGTFLVRGSYTIANTLTTTSASILRAEGDYSCCSSYFYITNGFTNNGAIQLGAVNGTGAYAYIGVTNGTLTNAAGATIVAETGTGGTRQLDAQLDNQGTLTVNQALTMNRPSSVTTSSGTIDINGGDLTIQQGGTSPSFTNTGTITIGAGRALAVTYGTFNQSAGSIGGAGVLALNSSTANLTTNFSTATTGLALSSATVNGPGTLTNAAGRTITLNSSTIAAPFANSGTLVARGTSYLTSAPSTVTTTSTSVIESQGDYSCCSSYFYVTNGFTNNGAINLNAINGSGAYAFMEVTNGTLVNAPGAFITAQAGTGGTRQLNAQIDNQGTLTVDQALTMGRASSVSTSSGAIDINGGDLTITQAGTGPSFSNSGAITIASGRSLIVNYGVFNQAAGGISGAGTLSLNSTTANITTAFSNSTTGLVLNSSTVNGPGTLTNTTAHTLNVNSSTIASPLVNQGTLVMRGTSYITSAPGAFTTTGTSVMEVQGDYACCSAYFYVTNGFTNNGAINLNAINGTGAYAYMEVTNGTLVNAGGASITSQAGTGGTRQLNAQIDNQGTVTVSQQLTMGRSSSISTNSGTIDITGANLVVNQSGTTPSFSNTGTLNIAAGYSLTVNNGVFNQSAGSIAGNGTLSFSAATANFTTNFSDTLTALVLNSSTVNGPGTISNVRGRTLTLQSSTIAAPLANRGTLITHGTSYLTGAAGTFTTDTSSVLRAEGDYNCCSAYLYVTNGFSNSGIVRLSAINGTGAYAFIGVTNGTLVNLPGAQIVSDPGTGGTRQLDAQVDNQGTMTINQPLAMGRSSSVHTNSGTIDILGGDLTISQAGTTPSINNTGSINVATGRTWTINSGTLNQSAGSIGGLGSFVLNSVTANLTTSFSNATTGFTLNSSTVNGPGTLTNAASRSLTIYQTNIAAPFLNQGTLIARGSSTISSTAGNFTADVGSSVIIQADYSCCSSTFTVTNGFTNHGTIDLTAINGTGSSAAMTVTNGTLTNASDGTLLVSQGTGGARTLTAELLNQGTVTVSLSNGPTPAAQVLTINRSSSAHVNAGTFTVNSGDVTLNQSGSPNSFTNNNTLTIAAGRTWTVNSGTFTQSPGATLDGTGTLALNSVAGANFNTVFALGALNINNSTANFATGSNLTNSSTFALNVSNSTLNGPDSLINAVNQTLTLNGTTNIGSGTVMPVRNSGVLVLHGSNRIYGPATTLTQNGILRLEGSVFGTGTLTVDNAFTNDSTIELTNNYSNGQAAQLTVTAGTLTNLAGSIISVIPGLNGGARYITAQIDNQAGGVIQVDQPLQLNRGTAVYTNAGTINIAGGDLTLSSATSFTNSGTITIGSAPLRTWTINSGTFTQQAGATLNGGGVLTLNSVTAANFNSLFTVSALNINNSTANFATGSNVTNSPAFALNLTNATLNGPDSLINAANQTLTLDGSDNIGPATVMPVRNSGLMVVHGSNRIYGPATTLTQNGILRLEGSSFGTGTLTVDNSFVNDSLIEMSNNYSNGQAAQLTVTAGTLTNLSGSVISVIPGLNGGARYITAQIDNQAGGVIQVDQPLQLNRGTAVYTNAGTINVAGGDLTLSSATSFTNSGTITVGSAPLRTWTINSGTFTEQAGATLNGGGVLTLNSVTATNFNAPFTLSALNVNNSTATFASGVNVTNDASFALTLSNATLNGPGTLTNAAGQTLTLANSTDIGTTTVMPVTNNGVLLVHGTSRIYGPTNTLVNNSVLRLEGSSNGAGTLTVDNGFTNGNLIELTNSYSNAQNAQLTVTAGTLINPVGSLISAIPGTNGGARYIYAQIDNQGTMTLDQPLTLGANSVDYTNSGTINLNGGDLTLNQGGTTPTFTNTGTVSIAPARLWTINGGTLTAGLINGGGSLTLNTVTSNFSTPFTLGALSLSSGTANFGSAIALTTGSTTLSFGNSVNVNGPGTLTNAAGRTLTLSGSVFGATQTMPITNNGTLVVQSTNTVHGGAGTLVNAAGATLRVEGSNFGAGTLALDNAFTNNGAVELSNSYVNAQNSQITLTTGTFTNAGTLTSLAGTNGGTRTINAAVTNAGTMTVGGVGAAGRLTINGQFTQGSGGVLNMELGGTTAGTLYDQLVVQSTPGSVSLAGTINVSTINSFVPTGNTFDLATFLSNPLGTGFTTPLLPSGCSFNGPVSTFYRIGC